MGLQNNELAENQNELEKDAISLVVPARVSGTSHRARSIDQPPAS